MSDKITSAKDLKLTKMARYLLHKKYYPRQMPIQKGRVSNTNKAVYNTIK